MEVKNIFMSKSYDITDSERVPIISKWLGFEGLHFMQTLTDEEWETCKSSADLFTILNTKFKPQHHSVNTFAVACGLYVGCTSRLSLILLIFSIKKLANSFASISSLSESRKGRSRFLPMR